MLLSLPALALALQIFGSGQRAPLARVPKIPPNIVVILADDFGVDLVRGYGESMSAPCTVNIDTLAGQGMLFRNCWGNPVCSPARAAFLTGRYGFRTGIGNVLTPAQAGLPLAELTIPEILTDYVSACVGKWHLSGNLGSSHPNDSGFAHFAGFLQGAVADYSDWTKVVNGRSSASTTYSTIDITHEAIASMQTMSEPWFLYVAYNAPHAPLHVPPSQVCHKGGCGSPYCSTLPPRPSAPQLGRAMVESLDAELGRLLVALEGVDPTAYVFLLADNGTAESVSVAPFLPAHAKGTVYEGGVNVPLIVRGPGVVHGECTALVSVVDLFATLAELARVPTAAEDSVSMVPYFANPALALRANVYTESFSPNGGVLPFVEHRRAVRDARYKLMRVTGAADEFYDLMLDPFETTNLLPGLSAKEQTAFDALEAELVALGVD